jgi:2,3-bisphosphoglycerate-independent phosphoglycerate mutase
VLVLLDGLGDRAVLDGGARTPAEAADTPVLDALAATGASGLHVPLGPGRAPSSELAHWSLLGYSQVPFCGRAVLEALGHGLDVPEGVVQLYLSLRPSRRAAGRIWPVGRAGRSDEADAVELFDSIASFDHDGLSFSPTPVRAGEAILSVEGATSADITDTDPLFEHHPWMRPLPLASAEDNAAATRSADALFAYLRWARSRLSAHSVNERRRNEGREPLDVPTTKWSGRRRELPSFERVAGLKGAIVASGALYAGLARLLGMGFVKDHDSGDPGADMQRRLTRATELVATGVDYVHVHTKATDEAGHTKDPKVKRAVIESLDSGLRDLLDHAFGEHVVCVTADHATPSNGPLLHSGDPSPLVVRSPGLRPDGVLHFGESHAAAGSLGTLGAADVLPLLVGLADRAAFLGSTIDPHAPVALIDEPAPMPED